MTFTSLFIRIKRSIGGIQLDSVLEETHNNTVRITTNPVESGVDISDHAVVVPKKVKLKAIVTDSPLGVAAFAAIVDNISGLFGTSTSGNTTRSQQAYNALVALMDAREPLELVTRLVVYTDMLITHISVSQNKDTSQVVILNIELEQVIITSSEVVDIPESSLASGSTKKQASSSVNSGRQEPSIISGAPKSSILNNAIKLLGG